MNQSKVAYIHGRPTAHPMHQKFAKSVGAEFHYVDFRMRWQDRNKSVLYRLISWFVCALTFPNKKQYDIFLIDNLHFMPVIMKMFGLINRKQKIVAHMGSHTLYFIYSHRFSKLTEWLHIQALKRYDALICEGKMAEELIKLVTKNNHPKTYVNFLGIAIERFNILSGIAPNLNGTTILLIANGTGEFRAWYKGLDLMLESFETAKKEIPDLNFTIVGDWEESIISSLLTRYCPKSSPSISFVGQSNNLSFYLEKSSLYLHCARGEAWGLSISEAMAGGVPPIISEWTGAKEVVEQVDKRLIVPLNAQQIADKIIWYFKLSIEEKKILSVKCREIAKNYTEEKAIELYKVLFKKIEKDIRVII